MNKFRAALILIVVILFGIFLAQNTEVTEVRFLMFNLAMSRVILLFIVFAGGFIAGYTVSQIQRRRKTRQVQAKQKQQ